MPGIRCRPRDLPLFAALIVRDSFGRARVSGEGTKMKRGFYVRHYKIIISPECHYIYFTKVLEERKLTSESLHYFIIFSVNNLFNFIECQTCCWVRLLRRGESGGKYRKVKESLINRWVVLRPQLFTSKSDDSLSYFNCPNSALNPLLLISDVYSGGTYRK